MLPCCEKWLQLSNRCCLCVFVCVLLANIFRLTGESHTGAKNHAMTYIHKHSYASCMCIHIRVRTLTALRRVIQLLYGIMCDNTLYLICTFVCAGSFVRGDVSTHVSKVTVWHVRFGTELIKYNIISRVHVICFCICQMC